MISRYSTPEMDHYWSDEHKLHYWTRIEQAAYEVNQHSPHLLDGWQAPVPAAVAEREHQTGHDVEAFVQVLTERVAETDPEAARFVHWGLCSSDVVDTALALTVNQSMYRLRASAHNLHGLLADMAIRERDTARIGRTHGQHAAPTTFGHQLDVVKMQVWRWYRRTDLTCNMTGKMSGPVGTYKDGFTKEQEDQILRALGFRDNVGSPPCTQVVPRDMLAIVINELAILASIVENLAEQIRLGSQTEVGELAEGAAWNRVGSSSMPHKHNPIQSEQLVGLAGVARSYVVPCLQNISLWGERDISNSSVERIMVPDAFKLTHYMVQSMRSILANLEVNGGRMRENLETARRRGSDSFSEVNALVAHQGFSRAKAREFAADPRGLATG